MPILVLVLGVPPWALEKLMKVVEMLQGLMAPVALKQRRAPRWALEKLMKVVEMLQGLTAPVALKQRRAPL